MRLPDEHEQERRELQHLAVMWGVLSALCLVVAVLVGALGVDPDAVLVGLGFAGTCSGAASAIAWRVSHK